MTQKTTPFAPVTGFMRQMSLSILMPFFRKTDKSPVPYPKYESSIFSQPDQSELLAMEEEICPLVEAEVYVIYGRKADARKVLNAGVRSGRITADEAARFWDTKGKAAGQTPSN
ncbi:MAG: hypothetical protein CVU33_06325 [Betaproteobacteria bacterium HGW-Betaproteobacteria-6]|jgi:hypothetical protein|nr:MAG: hypothetical protein CVU33_06325 [Betaproteobacteria bacterium HGW-Betaproteobacteria-6]